MIELLQNLPDEVVGFVASGEVTDDDYEKTVIPAIESAIEKNGKVRILYQIGPAFTGFTAGAMWEDAKLGLAHLRAWEKIAVVTDVNWVREGIQVFRFAIPCPVRVFPNDELNAAIQWVAA